MVFALISLLYFLFCFQRAGAICSKYLVVLIYAEVLKTVQYTLGVHVCALQDKESLSNQINEARRESRLDWMGWGGMGRDGTG